MKRKGTIWIALGLLLIAAALLLTVRNLWENRQAKNSVLAIIDHLDELIPSLYTEGIDETIFDGESMMEEEIPDYILNPDKEMPTETIDGNEYIGVLEITSLKLKLPVMSGWSYPKLKIAPCRYEGSAYTGNLIIMAHNYIVHFGLLKNLHIGDEITFTDIDGNRFCYKVLELETLMPTAIDDMTNGDWDMTLFTCSIGGKSRVTVRCVLDNAIPAREKSH